MSDGAPTDSEELRADRFNLMPMCAHRVDLERVQRCHLEIDDEPMLFNEATIADMLQQVADDLRYGHEAFVVRAIVNALRGEDDHHKLILRQTKRGKWESPADDSEKHRQRINWVIETRSLEAEGWQTDAAVHHVAAQSGVSVSTVYAGIKEEQGWQDYMKEAVLLLEARTERTPKAKK